MKQAKEGPVFYIGIDGGGTKSSVMLAFEDGTEPVVFSGGPLNICSGSVETVKANLANILAQAAKAAGGLSGCGGVGIGVAGFSHPQSGPFFIAEMDRRLPGVPVAVRSDALVALYGAHLGYEGIILMSGTGSVCFGARGGVTRQAGGGGHIIDDAGSGYAIGRDILAAVIQAQDDRIPPTALRQLLGQVHNLSTTGDIVDFVYADGTRKEDIAAFAPLLTAACEMGDAAALRIAEKASEDLLTLLHAVVKRLDMPCGPLALGGSILNREPFVCGSLHKKLAKRYPNMICYGAKDIAAAGAILLAKRVAAGE